jgi:ABC-type antimicrobial peptide transport system permease subunit
MLFAAITGEDILYCCGMFPILPLVVLLVIVALIRNSLWSASFALLIAGLPYVILQIMVALYEPSTDGEVAADQFTGRSALGFYDWIVAGAGLSLLWVVVARTMHHHFRPAKRNPSSSAPLALPPLPPHLPTPPT